ncbi:cytochrome C oxidase Cbb3 [Helicobacter monodelphidis]|uniref:c-type cytochrome n=1 Tax=Helicobacter sp. 15-1451 TaxID=2004995 RepID=UPI000DCC8655|nr:c-type cytochrome [Helicobacter sp. 15-1451]RAX56874.1 cytochrome C oxidase Cbb3 [Helicobacter sp. 15-1451]
MEWFNLSDSINLLSLVGAAAILALTLIIAGGYIKKMKHSKADGTLSKEKWDGIREFINDIPFGWGATYIVLMIWGLVYFFYLYPLGGYSQLGEYNEEVKAFQERLAQKTKNATEDDLRKMGGNLFVLQCAQCHGPTGEGMDGKAVDLTRWGSEEGIIDTINKGSKGLLLSTTDDKGNVTITSYPMGEIMAPVEMPADDAKAIAAFVMQEVSTLKKTKYPELVERGRELFMGDGTCATCHGADGAGMGGMAPDLTTYGTTAFLSNVFAHGKKGLIGQMPAFKEPMISEIQKEALMKYILSIQE